MRFWRGLLRLFGLLDETRVQVRAAGIEVTIRGDDRVVREVLEVVRGHLERRALDKKKGWLVPEVTLRLRRPGSAESDGAYVQPSELDGMDSPYVINDALVRPPAVSPDSKPAARVPSAPTPIPAPDSDATDPSGRSLVAPSTAHPLEEPLPQASRSEPTVRSMSDIFAPGVRVGGSAQIPLSTSVNNAIVDPEKARLGRGTARTGRSHRSKTADDSPGEDS